MNKTTLIDRFIMLVDSEADQKRRYKSLEEATGVPATSWTSVMRRRQRPTAEMIEAVARLWPRYSLWLASGDVSMSSNQVSLPVTVKIEGINHPTLLNAIEAAGGKIL